MSPDLQTLLDQLTPILEALLVFLTDFIRQLIAAILL